MKIPDAGSRGHLGGTLDDRYWKGKKDNIISTHLVCPATHVKIRYLRNDGDLGWYISRTSNKEINLLKLKIGFTSKQARQGKCHFRSAEKYQYSEYSVHCRLLKKHVVFPTARHYSGRLSLLGGWYLYLVQVNRDSLPKSCSPVLVSLSTHNVLLDLQNRYSNSLSILIFKVSVLTLLRTVVLLLYLLASRE
jgi:hypothetical protein